MLVDRLALPRFPHAKLLFWATTHKRLPVTRHCHSGQCTSVFVHRMQLLSPSSVVCWSPPLFFPSVHFDRIMPLFFILHLPPAASLGFSHIFFHSFALLVLCVLLVPSSSAFSPMRLTRLSDHTARLQVRYLGILVSPTNIALIDYATRRSSRQSNSQFW